jgi:glycosyltransferase involved in cell wall biosynthesis
VPKNPGVRFFHVKIGFYGNANNYPFTLARALQRLGHHVHFLISSPEKLNRPEFRYSDITRPYPPWIVDVTRRFRWQSLLPSAGRKIRAELSGCDLLFLNEEGPALAIGLKIPSVVLLTGSNVEIFADPAMAPTLKPQVFPRPAWLRSFIQKLLPTSIIHRWLTFPQRSGIQNARLVTHLARGLAPRGDAILDSLGIGDDRRFFLLMTDLEMIAPTPPPNNPILRAFCGARLTWLAEPGSDLTAADLKGTDILLHGVALFERRTGRALELHLVRKGRHVAQTAALADKLGIAGLIVWHDEMAQSDFLVQCRLADIVFDQFAESIVAMAGLDAMATGRPLIANGRPEIIEPLIGEPSPICQARSAEEICRHLERLSASPEDRLRLGLEGRRYVEKHFSPDAGARKILARLA